MDLSDTRGPGNEMIESQMYSTKGFNLELGMKKKLQAEFDEETHMSHNNKAACAIQFTEVVNCVAWKTLGK